MPGTKSGAALAMQTIKELHGDDFHRRIGKIGGANGHKSGFYIRRDVAKRMGQTVGKRSKVGYNLVYEDQTYRYYEHKETGVQLRYLINNTFKPQPGKYRTYWINGIEMGVQAIADEYGITYITANNLLKAGWMPWNVDTAP